MRGVGEQKSQGGLAARRNPPLSHKKMVGYASLTHPTRPRHSMLTLYSYPELFGVADNNGYGLKVFAFLKLAGVPFTHAHVFDASAAPRGQLPYIVDDGEMIGDSETIIAHCIGKYRLDHRCRADARAAHDQPSGHPHAGRSLLGDVVFALEGRAFLSGVSRRLYGAASADRRGRAEQGPGIQRAALLFPGHRPLHAGAGLCARVGAICRCWRT